MNVIGSGSPRKVPKARRMMRSAPERSPSLNGRTETSGFTSTIGVLLLSTQPHQVASLMQVLTQKGGQDKACKVRQPYINTKIITEYDVRQGAGCVYSLYCLEGVSLLKNTPLGM